MIESRIQAEALAQRRADERTVRKATAIEKFGGGLGQDLHNYVENPKEERDNFAKTLSAMLSEGTSYEKAWAISAILYAVEQIMYREISPVTEKADQAARETKRYR